MDIENVKTVLKVAEYASINKASLAVYKTQSQVSRIVKDFEELVNTKIFERSNKGVKVTADGEIILNYCKKILDLYNDLVFYNNQSASKNMKYQGALNIYNSTNIHSTTSELLASFSTNYPKISVKCVTMFNNKIISAIKNDSHSIGIFAQLYTNGETIFPIDDTLFYNELFTVPIAALCRYDSPYVQKYKSLSAKSLSALPLIQYAPHNENTSFTATILQAIGISNPKFQYSVDDLRILQQLLDKNAGVYVGVIPSPKLLTDTIATIPIRHKVTVGFGTLIQKDNKDELVSLFNQYLIDWYKKVY